MNHRNLLIATLACAALCLVGRSHAQNPLAESGAQSLLIDPSVRASGMGRSSNAVFWGYDTNYWSNPSLLAYRQGIQYERGRTQLIPELADDVYFTTKRVTLGGWGVGISVAGKPIDDLGGLRLDYGESIATDVDGNEIGRFRSYENTRSFAAGVNVLEFVEHGLKAAGREMPSLSRFGDVGVGWSEKRTQISLVPANLTQSGLGVEGDVTTHDSGLLVRVTPYDGIDHAGLLPEVDRVLGVRLDGSYGGSTQNYNKAIVTYVDPDQTDPVARIQIKGWAAHAALDMPRGRREDVRSLRFGWLIDLVSPLVSAGLTKSKQLPLIADPSGALLAGEKIENSGWEVTIANIYSFRGGKIDDPAGSITGHTKGWGIGLHLKDALGFSYDEATVPQSSFLRERVHRKAWTLYFNPIVAWEYIRGGRTRV